ncbi:MAG: hypothetical protein F6K11_02130 [Leptolyngbya sp. SIO3F4]|nr:hypothetical protein [Leptolyngbya sp. SIO3F4]
MFNSTQLFGKDLESLVRTALFHKELSPGVSAAIENYRAKSGLSTAEKRQLEIFDRAINDGCITKVQNA